MTFIHHGKKLKNQTNIATTDVNESFDDDTSSSTSINDFDYLIALLALIILDDK